MALAHEKTTHLSISDLFDDIIHVLFTALIVL